MATEIREVPSLGSTLDDIQREAILRALQSCGWIIGGTSHPKPRRSI